MGYPTEFRFDKSFKHTTVVTCDVLATVPVNCDCTPHEQNPRNSTEPAVVFIPVLNRENRIVQCTLHWNENKSGSGTSTSTVFTPPLLGARLLHTLPSLSALNAILLSRRQSRCTRRSKLLHGRKSHGNVKDGGYELAPRRLSR